MKKKGYLGCKLHHVSRLVIIKYIHYYIIYIYMAACHWLPLWMFKLIQTQPGKIWEAIQFSSQTFFELTWNRSTMGCARWICGAIWNTLLPKCYATTIWPMCTHPFIDIHHRPQLDPMNKNIVFKQRFSHYTLNPPRAHFYRWTPHFCIFLPLQIAIDCLFATVIPWDGLQLR